MKKLFFTAIALVAFNGVSMANTIAEENLNLCKEVITVESCASYATRNADAEERKAKSLSDECFTAEEYNRMYNIYYNFCIYMGGQ